MLEWKDNLNILNLYATKDIILSCGETGQLITFSAPSLRDLISNFQLNICVGFLKKTYTELQKAFEIWEPRNFYDIFVILITKAGVYREYIELKTNVWEGFKVLFKKHELTCTENDIYIDDVFLDEGLFNIIIYLLKKLNGESVQPPVIAKTPEEQAFLDEMNKMNEKVARIKGQNKSAKEDDLLKIFATICYIFPMMTFDYLLDQTMYQISWLQKYASKGVNYSIEEKAFAAGNMKKKLKFFLEK